MYETFFGLKRQPFLFTPDVESYCSVDLMEESRQAVEHAIQKGEGISLVFGAAGTGKTLLMRILQQALETEHTVILVSNSRLDTSKALFLQLAHDLRLSGADCETIELRLQILDFARKELAQKERGVVLLFDDAQHLDPSVLEEIRLLTDSSEGTASLFRVVLAGTPDFEERLTLPKLEAFNQRIVSRCYLDSFTCEETFRYVVRQTDDLRIDPPHGVLTPLFTEAAKRRVYQLTVGVPRLINQLCRTALQFAAEREKESVDETLVCDAWANLQHIDPIETNPTESSAVLGSVIPPEQIEEMIVQKRKTFQIRRFDPVEFGTLTDSEPEPVCQPRSLCSNDYKPPYPEDDDAENDDCAEWEAESEDEPAPVCRVLQLHAPAVAKALVIPKRKIVPDFYKQERKFRRKYLLRKIQCRLGLFVGVLRKTVTQLHEYSIKESDMNEQSLQEYGAAVLDGRFPFVRKEPRYAYQTPEVPPRNDVTYPDPATGTPITLRWLPENTGENERFGVSYSEFLNREKTSQCIVPEVKTESPTPSAESSELAESPILRTSLNVSVSDCVVPSHCSGLEEFFEESQQVGNSAISLAELFRAESSALQRVEESPEFKSLDESIQCQLEAVVKRIIKAAEKIEQAAAVSEQAGRNVTKAAEFVESEVRTAVPTYMDLFRQLSEFQEILSAELESHQQWRSEPQKLRTAPRHHVVIERAIPSIDVKSLFR